MLRCPGLPFLPGTTFRDISKTKYHRSHHWGYYEGVPMCSLIERPGIGGEPLSKPDSPPHHLPSLYPPYSWPRIPGWIIYDKKVLCFHAYFQETLQEVHMATHQVRKVKILFYLEDGTIQVSEPKVSNSGIPQGCLVGRQRVPRPPPCQNEFISLQDINVNQTLRMYDRVYMITGCDPFTRIFLNRLGISVPDNVTPPPDPSTEYRKKKEAIQQPKKPSVVVDTLGKFLKMDKQILRFFGYWDDTGSEFGDIRKLVMYFHLADDTMEIKELLEENSGRDSGGKFLTRGKLPKCWNGLGRLGEHTPNTILNVFGSSLKGSRYIVDPLDVGAPNIQYYKEEDLTLGTHINVYGRTVVLTDCDAFTKEFYRKKYGIEDFHPIHTPENRVLCSTEGKEIVLPPFNGWGTHEDSEGNCKTVEPKPPKIDFNKFISMDSYILRFGGKMLSNIKDNNDRIFIISYYLANDTISVYELGIKNSGFLCGDFFKRSIFYLPNQEWFTSGRPRTYTSQHLYIGAKLKLRDFDFLLVTADLFALTYMENNADRYPYSNIDLIINKIREALRPCYKDFVAKHMQKVCNITENDKVISLICFDALREAFIELLGNNITDHEIVTICRHFSAEHKKETLCKADTVRAVVHLELRRGLWDSMDRLKQHLYNLDPECRSYLPQKVLYHAILACRLPLNPSIIDNMFTVLKKNGAQEIDVCDFLSFIDVMKTPSTPQQPLLSKDVCPVNLFNYQGRMIDWNCLLSKINLENELKN